VRKPRSQEITVGGSLRRQQQPVLAPAHVDGEALVLQEQLLCGAGDDQRSAEIA